MRLKITPKKYQMSTEKREQSCSCFCDGGDGIILIITIIYTEMFNIQSGTMFETKQKLRTFVYI